MKINKIYIIFFMLMIHDPLLAGRISFNASGFSPEFGKDWPSIQQQDSLYLDPLIAGSSLKVYKNLNLARAHKRKIKSAYVIVNTTSQKRMKITITAMNLKSRKQFILASKIIPNGLTKDSFYRLKILKKKRIHTGKFTYQLMIEFLDGAATNVSEDQLMFYSLNIKFRK